jgi:hypothetical protein
MLENGPSESPFACDSPYGRHHQHRDGTRAVHVPPADGSAVRCTIAADAAPDLLVALSNRLRQGFNRL